MKYLQELIVYYLLTFSIPLWDTLIAGAFVLVTLSSSFYLLFEHLSAYRNPEEQKFLIGVILMVPCYAVESFVSLLDPSISVDIEILRDCYESFAMYCFGRYLVACLGGEERTIEFLEREGRSSSKAPLLEHNHERGIIKHPFPMNYIFKPWKLGQWFYQVVKFGIVQYMLIKSLTAVLAVLLEAFGVYCEGDFKLRCGYPYMAVVLNFSQSWALYCLVQFYAATKDELAHIKPLYKFLTFKSIVFLTWWQGVAIALLYSLGLFKSPIAQGLQLKSSIQDFIICIEMGIASIVHLYVFPAKPYELMGDRFPGSVAVLGDYVSVDCPIDPDEVRDSERPTKLRLPQPDIDVRSGMTIKESVRDVVVGGGGFLLPPMQIVNDVRFTVNQAVEPVEKGIIKFNEKLHRISQNMKQHNKDKRRTKDDSCIATSSPTRRVIRGIDDPLLNGSFSDTGLARGKKHHRRKSGYISGESGGESSSDQSYGAYQLLHQSSSRIGEISTTRSLHKTLNNRVLLNGRLHWLSWIRMHYKLPVILSFHLADDRLQVVPKPNGCGSNGCGYQLVILGDCLLQHHCATKENLSYGYGIWSGGVLGQEVQHGSLLAKGTVRCCWSMNAELSSVPKHGTFKDLMYHGVPGLYEAVLHAGNLRWIDSVTETWCAEKQGRVCFS
ncbi:hypothetical protein D5086_018898 [Populus alba]|uniref:Uncharacterized protein n=1 Tax=Populus alba TaxID=43335 RepID=A0ACC4BR20_POPAL